MSFKATTIRDTQIVSVRHDPVDVDKGTPITVWDEANGWALVDAKVDGAMVSGEMSSDDYKRDA